MTKHKITVLGFVPPEKVRSVEVVKDGRDYKTGDSVTLVDRKGTVTGSYTISFTLEHDDSSHGTTTLFF